jgi:hypothetical protein
MAIDNLARVYNLIQSSGGAGSITAPGPSGVQVVTANAVGGGSNLYLAASLRSPQETFERRDHRADDGEDRRMWPKEISRKTLDPYYARAERGLRVSRPTWRQVSKAGGLWAAALRAAVLLGESPRERQELLARLRADSPSSDAVRRALVETVIHGDRPGLVTGLDEALLGLRPRPGRPVGGAVVAARAAAG